MSNPVVTVKQGDLRGLEVKSATGGSHISFKGIPYATPPVGDLRFRDPQPPQPWSGVRDAFTEGQKCAQSNLYTKKITGGDDCLYLNVATTSLTESRPVMVWIHGGAFVLGDGGSALYGPDYIMDSGVVYVSVNYRLGVLGFLHLDHEVAPGNAGLKDLVAALKWVKENIAQFGGDPNNVTIFGISSGSQCVHYLLLSPLAKGLFHKAIMQSGVLFHLFTTPSATVDMVRRYVISLGGDFTDPNEIVKFLRTVPVHRLIEAQANLLTAQERADSIWLFGPSVDDKSFEPFMPRPHEEVAAEGFDVPVIIGHTSHEGIFFLSDVFSPPEFQKIREKKLRENFAETLPRNLLAGKSPSKVSEIAREIRKFYFGDEEISIDLVDGYARYLGDLILVYWIQKVVEIQQGKNSPTYFYRFSYDSPKSIAKTLYRPVKAKGAMHAEDLYYLFFPSRVRHLVETSFGATEILVRDRLVRMWTDFAKTGNPTPIIDDVITKKWEPVTKSTKNYLQIDAELSVGVNPDQDTTDIWNWAYGMQADD